MALGFHAESTLIRRDNNATDFMTAVRCCCGLNVCVSPPPPPLILSPQFKC